MGASGSIIAGLKLKDAALLGYDTRTHSGSEGKKIPNMVQNVFDGKSIELKNKKVYLAQYCAFAGGGKRLFCHIIHQKLLKKVKKHLNLKEGPEMLSCDELVKFIIEVISNEIKTARDKYEKDKTDENLNNLKKVKRDRSCCCLILATWEVNEAGEYDLIMKKFKNGRFIDEEVDCCALCNNFSVFAETLMKKEYDVNMSIQEGSELIVRGIKEAATKDPGEILGGDIEVLVFGRRDFLKLPLSRRQQTLDRAVTIINKGPLRKKEEGPSKKKQKVGENK